MHNAEIMIRHDIDNLDGHRLAFRRDDIKRDIKYAFWFGFIDEFLYKDLLKKRMISTMLYVLLSVKKVIHSLSGFANSYIANSSSVVEGHTLLSVVAKLHNIGY